jgi:class 3 adenylate cyclase/tetratricopeptide (TPR) repeat protein/ribosomal protein L40E
MKCPKCQYENPADANFCGKCREKLFPICTQCGAENSPENSFCNKCGHNLTLPSEPPPKDLSFDEKLDKIQRYLPKGLTEKILSQRNKIEGERKQVTVMFCDMEGFTNLSERLGPEEAYSIMDQVYEILIHKVHDYEGTVNEMTGDGIMALFGAPIALEDASQRAIRSAYAIHREMTRFSNKIGQEKEGIQPLKMRIGIHTGPVVVGTLGNDLRVEFKAVGDTVNLASRMEGLAEPGATYVTEETFKLTEGLFRFEALGEKEIKGKEKPVQVYRAIVPSTSRTRFDVSAERGLTPFVGRERELELLLDGFERAKGGRGQTFSVMAEAGVGKSRFLYEFRKAVINEDVTFLEGKCLSYSRGVAYHPVIDVLKANFDVREEDGDSEITEKVKRGLKILGADEALTLPYLLELLSVKDTGIDKISMSPEEKRDRIMEAVKGITVRGSEIRPLIIAIEDLHWIDKSSEDYLKNLLDNISGARVLLIFTYRPEFVHTWGGRSYHNQVNLNRLSNRESLAMVSYLFGTEKLDNDLEELLLEKTEGIPFFIEEFIKSLKDRKIIERKDNKYHLAKDMQEVTIPSTIQDVIMARVDSLPEGAKELLQTGSVIEREFSHELIKGVMDLPEQELMTHLSVLKDSELLYERGIYPQSTYIFKHALTLEVVYDSILTKRKKKLHGEIGQAIEELYKDNIDVHYGALASHFIEAGNYEKGALYSELAAKKANMAASSKEVFEHSKKRILCSEKLPSSDATNRKIIDARTALAAYYINYSYIVEANEVVAPIADLAQEMDYQKRLPMIFVTKGSFSIWFEEDYIKGHKFLNKALKISEKTKDKISFWLACWQLALLHSWNCQFVKGSEYFEKCLQMSISNNNLLGISSVKSTLSSMNYLFQGRIDLAYQVTEDSLHVAEKSGDIFAKGVAYSNNGILSFISGIYDKTEDNLLKGLTLCERNKIPFFGSWTSGWLGLMYTEREEYEKAQTYFNKAISILSEFGNFSPSQINMWTVSIARAKVLNQDQDINLFDLFECYQNNKLKSCEGWMARDIGEILLSINDRHMNEAEDWINKAIEADKSNGMMWHLSRDYTLYAELFKRKGDQSKAKENLTKAIEIFKECSADGWVEKCEEEMALLS